MSSLTNHQDSIDMNSQSIQQIARLAFQGDFDQIRSLASPELVTCKDQNGRTVLMLTADTEFPSPWQSAKCIEYLLHLGADPFETTAGGDTAAHFAARRDNVRLLALLPFDTKWLQNVEGGSPLTEAIRSGSWRCAKHLLHLLRLRDRSSDKKKILNAESRSILSPARKEGRSGFAEIIERETRLVTSGYLTLTVTGLTEMEKALRRTLICAAMRGDVEEFQRLASCSNCDIPSSTGSTVLMDFVEVCDTGSDPELHASIRQRLIELSDVTAVDVLGNSCLHKAAADLGSPADCEALIAAGASVNSLNSLHQTPLMLAVRRPQVVEQLLRLGADWTRQNCYGDDALDLADGLGCRETSALLSSYLTRRSLQLPIFTTASYRNFFEERIELSSLCSPFLKTWTCIRLLGRGGIGEVHEVETDRGVKCAVKTIKLPMQGGNAQSDLISNIDTIVQGERNLCFLRHRNIVKFIEICHSEPFTVVLFMELLDGQSLTDFINGKPLDELFIQRFTGQICSALSYMHSRKPPVLHRDINCNNIIVLRGDSEIKLIDFGLSVQLNRSVSHVSAYTPTPKGTLYFLAPELLGADESDTVKYSPESDVWAMGCTVYQMVTGTLPHGHCSNMLALANCLSLQGAPKLTRPVSRKLVNFYADCVAQNRRLRKSAAELLRHEFLLNTEPDTSPVAAEDAENQPAALRVEPVYGAAPPQGACLLFCIGGDEPSLLADVSLAQTVFARLRFTVKVSMDPTCDELVDALNQTAFSQELSDHQCFVCCVLAAKAGTDGAICTSDGEQLELGDIIGRFKPNQCRGLRGKPKLFFFHTLANLAGSTAENIQMKDADFLVVSYSGTRRPSPMQEMLSLIDKRHTECSIAELVGMTATAEDSNLKFVSTLSKPLFLNPTVASG
ncbi:hypothetical protein BOX15_Mlig026099g1 [Macrostomum lignano]|uniref:Protein kinase domain-containing protein n=1 Tax=Macrostomum lignano TaxID=282301 RepID=A0A267DWS6_9PLAT|nr:hypothetical protein BOX15_Mlig026099g1 [Macrostomum lignano]